MVDFNNGYLSLVARESCFKYGMKLCMCDIEKKKPGADPTRQYLPSGGELRFSVPKCNCLKD